MKTNRVPYDAAAARRNIKPMPQRIVSRNASATAAAPFPDRLSNTRANGFRRSYSYETAAESWGRGKFGGSGY